MSNIIKGIYITFLTCFLSFGVKGQVLIENTDLDELNLNPGGIIHDVAEDPYGDYYILVGDFNLIAGNPVNNIAFIDKSTLKFVDVSGTIYESIDSVNGEIWSIETVYLIQGFSTATSHIILGGNFETIGSGGNETIRKGIVEFTSTISLSFPPTPATDFAISSWDAGLDVTEGFDEGIYDIHYFDSKLFIGGHFLNSSDNVNGINFAAFNFEDKTLLTNYDSDISDLLDDKVNHIFDNGSELFVSGGVYHNVEKFSSTGVLLNGTSFQFVPSFSAGSSEIFSSYIFEDSLIISYYNPPFASNSYSINRIDNGSSATNHPLFGLTPTNFNMPIGYNNQAVGINGSGNGVYSFKSQVATHNFATSSYQSTINTHNVSNETQVNFKGNMQIVDNLLFLSTKILTNVDSESRDGLAVFCLEPKPGNPFITFDTTICQGQIQNYSFSNVDYAEGYIWDYSGSGLELSSGGVVIENYEAGNSLNLTFKENFSEGTLTVTPYTTCGGLTYNNDTLFSKGVSLNIHLDVLPNINPVFPDTVINCINDTITLIGSSDSLGVSYSWNRENSPYGTEPVGQNLQVGQGDIYYLKITGSNGCINRDTILVSMDTIRPNFDPIIPEFLGCSDTNYVLGFCNNGTDTTSWWQAAGDATILPNPLEVSLIGQYKFYTQFASNGCTDSLAILVEDDLSVPNLNVFGYDSISIDPIDTLNCYNPSLNLQGISDTANTVVNWTDMSGTTFLGEFQSISSGGLYYLHVIDTSNNCTNTATVVIDENFTTPTLALPTDVTSLNCSNDSLVLNGSTSSSNTTLQWTGQTISPSANPLTIYSPGTFVFTVTLDTNGCSTVDSLTIIQDNSIDVIVSNDTAVCNLDNVIVSSGYVGNITGISYNWDNGSTFNTSTYIGGTDSIAIIEINGDGGCYGTDTIRIEIPPTPIVNFQAFQPCGSGSDGSIVASPISGWGPFEYSIDNGVNYQTSTAITGLDLGTYTILVKDTIGCEHPFTATIDATSAIATPQFLFSTYNFQGDTIIILDVSNPPADSVDWFFSSEIIVLTEDDTSALLILPDTGSFIVTMDAWFGTCLSSLTKEVFVSEFDSTNAEAFYSNGIKSIELYPNPNDGTFTINVEFYVPQNAVLDIYNMVPTNFEHIEYVAADLISQTITMPLEAMSGEYIIRIISDYDSAYIPFTLIK